MSIIRFISWLMLSSFVVVVGCTQSRPDPAQLGQLSDRVNQLEQRVHDLEVSNAVLLAQFRAVQPQPTAEETERRQAQAQKMFDDALKRAREQPHQIPTPRSQPPTNQEPRFTPL
jgi:membrane-bound lytic murein transglycosylase B